MGLFENMIGLFNKRKSSDASMLPTEDQAGDFGFESSIVRRDYGNQELNFFADVASSQFLYGVVTMIHQQTHLTEPFKLSLTKTCAMLLGTDMILANNNPTQIDKEPVRNNILINSTHADIILGLLVTNATKSDLENFDLTGFIRIIKLNYRALQSRTVGENRERLIMTELKTTMKSVSERVPITPQKEQKKGWFGI